MSVKRPWYRDESATVYDENREEIQTQASMIWGGKYVYGTWWTAEPLQVQGINLLPMTGASLYLAKDKDYIKKNYESARKLEQSYHGADKLPNPYDRWNDIWHEYLALADPEQAFANWSPTALEEGGESRAHTYHYMKSLEKYGTPDYSVKTNGILAQAFVKNGEKSYCAFNTSDRPGTFRFSDGGWIKVAPHTMYCGKSGTTNYTVPTTTVPVTTVPVSTVPVTTKPVEPTSTPTIEPSVSTVPTESELPTERPTAPPTETPSNVKVDCKYIGSFGGCINQTFELTSIGKEQLDLSKLTLLYNYKCDGNLPQNFTCTHAGLQIESAPYYQDLTNKINGVFKDGCLEIYYNGRKVE